MRNQSHKRMPRLDNRLIQRLISSTLAVVAGLASLGASPAYSQPQKQMHAPTSPPSQQYPAGSYEDDTLLIMPAANAEKDDINDALNEVHGRIVARMGSGRLQVLVVKTEKGKLAETEKKLGKDKHFSAIQRNYNGYPQVWSADIALSTDPAYKNKEEYYLGAVNAVQAWRAGGSGSFADIAIFDSGCSMVDDLKVHISPGFDSTNPADQQWPAVFVEGGSQLADFIDCIAGNNPGGQRDWLGHGTEVATTASALDNGVNTVGIAPRAMVHPVRINPASSATRSRPSGSASDMSIILALRWAQRWGIKIVNISYGPGYTNANAKPVLHTFLKDFYDNHNGLVFFSAGNDAMFDPNPPLYYMNVVAAVDKSKQKASFSNFGNSVTFCAPGVNIVCSDKNGSLSTVSGTSFASPICAGVASLIWSANRGLSNAQVISIMKQSCTQPGFAGCGWGIPDAAKAVNMALGN